MEEKDYETDNEISYTYDMQLVRVNLALADGANNCTETRFERRPADALLTELPYIGIS
jgi:hypothetical protein